MIQDFLDFLSSSEVLDYLHHNGFYIIWWLVGVPLFAALGREIDKQQRPKAKPKPRYKRVPVIPPKRNGSPVPQAPIAPTSPFLPPSATSTARAMLQKQWQSNSESPKSNPPIAPHFPTPPSRQPKSKIQNPKSKIQNPKSNSTLRAHPLTPKLLNLVNGDRPTATRLLSQERTRNPGKNETWYYEKVIWDLTRDRH